MRMVHEAMIHAAPKAVFALAADVERWPELDPAYRWCRVLDRRPHRTVFEMAGRIRGLPVRWTAIQDRFLPEQRIVFRHIHGITTGMVVQWQLAEAPAGAHVTLVHDLVMRWPLIGRTVSDFIIGPIFIDWIAQRTLRAVQAAVEGHDGGGKTR